MIGVLQVYARDVPELPFPDGTDRRMTHLATISSAEYGSDRWQLPEVPSGSSPHGIMIGDVGDMYLFTCTARNHRPLESVVQFH